ncbi:MAG TPA: MBL fold metallo-hydrolase [Bacteroidales bacterium]|nr:MBL fold metallo-hydrolase [Bacteroidales bacterium]
MLTLCAIASGSNGNCYYIGNHTEAVLIDAGISARQTVARMKTRELDPSKIRAIFISHEHSDHICGARVLSKKLKVPVFVTSQTYVAMYPHHRPDSPRFFIPGNPVTIGSFTIHPFPKQHDAAEPCSFTVEYKGCHVGVFTDIGTPCEHVIRHFEQCHVAFLESNYDEQMLWKGNYPWPLKKRIASEYGHLSNDQAYNLLANNGGSQLTVVFLSHLSAENNTPETAMNCFTGMNSRVKIHMTSRYQAGEVVRIEL